MASPNLLDGGTLPGVGIYVHEGTLPAVPAEEFGRGNVVGLGVDDDVVYRVEGFRGVVGFAA